MPPTASTKREADRRYREANRDRIRAYHAARYLRERDQRAIADRERRLVDPDHARERTRTWRHANPERARQHRREWLAEDPIRAMAVRKTLTANGRAKKFGVVGRIGYRDVLDLWEREPMCRDCGVVTHGIDHVMPLGRGGPNVPENLANRCLHCNKRKGVRCAA